MRSLIRVCTGPSSTSSGAVRNAVALTFFFAEKLTIPLMYSYLGKAHAVLVSNWGYCMYAALYVVGFVSRRSQFNMRLPTRCS